MPEELHAAHRELEALDKQKQQHKDKDSKPAAGKPEEFEISSDGDALMDDAAAADQEDLVDIKRKLDETWETLKFSKKLGVQCLLTSLPTPTTCRTNLMNYRGAMPKNQGSTIFETKLIKHQVKPFKQTKITRTTWERRDFFGNSSKI